MLNVKKTWLQVLASHLLHYRVLLVMCSFYVYKVLYWSIYSALEQMSLKSQY